MTAADKKPVSLVTGGAGFLGSHVADELISRGHKVVVLDDLSGGFVENVNAEAEFVEGSILDSELVDSLFAEHRFDYVFHLAAYAAEGLSHFIRRFNYMNNVVGSVNLVNAAVNAGTVRCFAFTSSIAVYGHGAMPVSEDSLCVPDDPYGIAKYTVEQDLKKAQDMFGQNYVIFRPHNVYGEKQNIWDKYRNVIGIFMKQILGDEPLTVFGDGLQTRAFTYVGDIVPDMVEAVLNDSCWNSTYNVGADEPCSVLDLAKLLSEVMAVPLKLEHLQARNEVVDAFADHGKLAKAVGAHPSTSLEEGLRRMTDWVRSIDADSRDTKDMSIEIRKNLPPSWGTTE